MKIHFIGCLKNKVNWKYELEKAYRIESNMYMSLWYGMLYVVIEWWWKLRLEDQNIQKLLRSKNVKLLEKYRNGVFHFEQNESYDGFEDFFEQPNTDKWARELTSEFSRWFLENNK